ncbi:MAG: DNA-methyltransferase [Longibaculum sp.]
MSWLEENLNSIVLGNSYELIKKIPDNSIDLIVTDPPYEIKQLSGGGCLEAKGIKKSFKDLTDNFLDVGIDEKIFDEFMRIMKKPNIYIWCNKTLIPKLINYFHVENKLSFELITWHKTNAMPLCGNSYLVDTEFCLYFRKGIKLNTTYETAKTHYELPINIDDKKLYMHPTIKPFPIIRNLINNSCPKGGIVFDPYNGSGTTTVVAKELGFNYLGIEINPKWYKISIDRLNGINANGQTSIFTDFENLEGK